MFLWPKSISILGEKTVAGAAPTAKPHGKFKAGDRFFVRDSRPAATAALYSLHEHRYRLRLCKGLGGRGGGPSDSETGQIQKRILSPSMLEEAATARYTAVHETAQGRILEQ